MKTQRPTNKLCFGILIIYHIIYYRILSDLPGNFDAVEFHGGSLGTPVIGSRCNSVCQPSANNYTRRPLSAHHSTIRKVIVRVEKDVTGTPTDDTWFSDRSTQRYRGDIVIDHF